MTITDYSPSRCWALTGVSQAILTWFSVSGWAGLILKASSLMSDSGCWLTAGTWGCQALPCGLGFFTAWQLGLKTQKWKLLVLKNRTVRLAQHHHHCILFSQSPDKGERVQIPALNRAKFQNLHIYTIKTCFSQPKPPFQLQNSSIFLLEILPSPSTQRPCGHALPPLRTCLRTRPKEEAKLRNREKDS